MTVFFLLLLAPICLQAANEPGRPASRPAIAASGKAAAAPSLPKALPAAPAVGPGAAAASAPDAATAVDQLSAVETGAVAAPEDASAGARSFDAARDYRGVSPDLIVSSLDRADAMLRGAALGPATTQRLDEWKARDPLEEIARAPDSKALAAAVRRHGNHLNRYHSVFEERALLDVSGRPGYVGAADLYRDLNSWGAFGGAELMAYYPIDGEMDAYRAATLVSVVRRGLWRPSALGRYALAASFMAQGAVERARLNWNLARALAASSRQSVTRFFLSLDIRHRHLLVDALSYISGLDKRRPDLAVESPMIRFGVALPDLPDNFGEMGKILGPLRARAEKILEPFYETDEIAMSGIGMIGEKDSGVIFMGSRRAAQALANALPDQVVVDSNGNRLRPKP
jgi:hypothetical protein